jgi:hypothetical protein
MPKVEESSGWDAVASRARRINKWRRKRRRIERFDILVASMLLLLLLLGWAKDFVRAELWPHGHLLTTHAWSGAALR